MLTSLNVDTSKRLQPLSQKPRLCLQRHYSLKLSMSEKALASKLYEVFDLKETKGIITSSDVVLIRELWRFPATGPPTLPTIAGYQVSTSDFDKTPDLLTKHSHRDQSHQTYEHERAS